MPLEELNSQVAFFSEMIKLKKTYYIISVYLGIIVIDKTHWSSYEKK